MDNLSFDDQETIREFLVESYENLARLDLEIVELEKRPRDKELLSGIFRTIHTMKGASGFLAFSRLERLAHQTENLLSLLRDGKLSLNADLVSLVLEAVDVIRKMLAAIEASGQEGDIPLDELIARLRAAAVPDAKPEAPAGPAPAQAAPAPSVRQPEPAAAAATAPAASQPAQAQAKAAPASAQATPRKPAKEEKAPAAGGAEEDEAARSAAADSNIRVGVGLLDKLMDLVGELVLTRNQIIQFNTRREDAELNATSQRLNLITSELQEGVMKTRMQPIGVVWNSLPRVVRDMSVALGKQIEIKMDGAGTELDRTIIEAIKDPLIHLVRNACDHGIELPEQRLAAGKPAQGTMMLRAFHEGGQVNIEISDDGGGIDIARVREKAVESGLVRPDQIEKLSERDTFNLVFQPGFSTARKVTNISGRGVGMDVVKSHIEKIGGVVDIFSCSGQGTTVKIRIPLTLAIIPGLVVSSGGERFVIPQASLLELIRLDGDGKRIENVHGAPVYRQRGHLLPVAYLNKVLGLSNAASGGDAVYMVVLKAEDRQFGLVVDGINDTQEIVVKALGKQLKGLTLYAGATIMGDGHVALILDVLVVGQRSGVLTDSVTRARVAEETKAEAVAEQQILLLFRAGSFERLAMPLSLVARLEEFPQTAIEHAGGGPVIQYRDCILPLVSLRKILEPQAPPEPASSDPAQVVVFNDGERMIGMVVDQIVDVTEETVNVRQASARYGLLGSAVVGKQVTDFLDLNAVIVAARELWATGDKVAEDNRNVLIADTRAFSRGLLKSAFDMEGYKVVEAANGHDALRVLDDRAVNLVIASLDLADEGAEGLVRDMRERSEWSAIRVLAVAESAAQARTLNLHAAGLAACESRFETTAILRAARQLLAESDCAEPEAEFAGAAR